MLLMVEKGIRRGICHSIYWYEKTNKKYMKDYNKNKESSYIQCWNANNLNEWGMSQKLPVNNFERIKDTSQFNEDSILKVDVQCIENLHELHKNLPFSPNIKSKRKKSTRHKALLLTWH